jgi:aspartate racemase
MSQDFYKGRLEAHGLEVIVPSKADRQLVHAIIYDELCLGQVKDTSRDTYLNIMAKMADSGAEGIIAGCTEITMLVQQRHTSIPLFDTTAIHAEEAVALALAG